MLKMSVASGRVAIMLKMSVASGRVAIMLRPMDIHGPLDHRTARQVCR